MPDSNAPPPPAEPVGPIPCLFALPPGLIPAGGNSQPGFVLAVPVFLPLVPAGPSGATASLSDEQTTRLIAALRDFYTSFGRWPFGGELTGPSRPSAGLNPTASSVEPGAGTGPGTSSPGAAGLNRSVGSDAPESRFGPAMSLNPSDVAPGPPGDGPATAGLNPTATGSRPTSDAADEPAARSAPRSRRPRRPRH